MINLIPPELQNQISKRMNMPKDRIQYAPDVGITPIDERAHKANEPKLPFCSFWMSEFRKNPAREQHNQSRQGMHLERGDANPPLAGNFGKLNPDFDKTFWRDVRLVPRDMVFDIAFYHSDLPFMHRKLCEWALWEETAEGDSSSFPITLTVQRRFDRPNLLEGKSEERTITLPLHISFEDPADNSDIAWGQQGLIFRTSFSMTIEAWCVSFGETPSILKIDSAWFDANREPPFQLFEIEHADERPEPEKC